MANQEPMKRILLVEDDPLIAGIYKSKLERRGFLAEIAGDGKIGLDKIHSWKPDLVLLDIILPKLGGLALLNFIRGNAETRALPVVVLTNSFSAGNAENAKRLGASHVLSKSETRPTQILDLISQILKVPLAPEPASEPPLDKKHQAECLQIARLAAPEMRLLLKEFFSKNDIALLQVLLDKAHAFTSNAWIAGLQRASVLSAAFEVLLRTLKEHPKFISLSTDRTLLQCIETLEALSRTGGIEGPLGSPSILVVDDDEVSRHAASFALKKSGLAAMCVKGPEDALKLLELNSFNAVLLDINMPNMNGMELCQHMRAMPRHAATPVIFFSQLSDIGHRIDSADVGGNDFIGKPFLTIELAVKTLIWIVKPQK